MDSINSKNNGFKFFKNKLCKKNETEIGNKNIETGKFKSKKNKLTIIYFLKIFTCKRMTEYMKELF